MTNRQSRRRYRKSADRRVWVFSELNHDLKPEQMAKILVSAALEQARLEQEARRQQAQEGQALKSEERDAPGEEVAHG